MLKKISYKYFDLVDDTTLCIFVTYFHLVQRRFLYCGLTVDVKTVMLLYKILKTSLHLLIKAIAALCKRQKNIILKQNIIF